MRTVQLYIENKRVDLFEDEQIEITSSVQNISDISKVFTDFSKSFTVPASDGNNEIFSYYYNNDLDEFDANTRVEARIEINHTRFREGKVQLEGSIVKSNQVEAYKINFYGDVVTLKDLFGEDKLKDLDYSDIQETYDGATVQNGITSTSDLDVRYPLISSSRVWTYGDAAATDISLSGNAIDYSELFPALKDRKIISLIEDKFGVTFNGNFIDNKRFTNSFTWWKNRETTAFTTEPIDLEFNAGHAVCNNNLQGAGLGVSLAEVKYVDPVLLSANLPDFSYYSSGLTHAVTIYISNTSNNGNYYVDVYKNGVLNNTISGSGNGLVGATFAVFQYNNVGLDDEYTFKVRSDSPLTFDFEIKYFLQGSYIDTSNLLKFVGDYTSCSFTNSVVLTGYLDFNSSAPDIKISDWFSGTLKEFNLTCYPLDDTLTFQIEPLEDWYAYGGEVDITPHVDTDQIEYNRAKLYNEISFEWQKSKSFMNEAFLEINNRPYGDLKEIFPNYDGGKYSVKLPFETLLFNKFSGENLQVGYSLTKSPDYKPYIPKPVKLYLSDNITTDVDFYLDNSTTVDNITSYLPFGQDLDYNASDFSMNFGEEVSSLKLNPIFNSLYSEYYQTYLINLFNTKTRLVTVKCVLPLNKLTALTLDDAVIIRDKKYRINDMKTNLTTGEVKLVLISDWVKERRKKVTEPIGEGGGVIVIPIKPPKGGWIDIDLPIETPFVTSDPTLPATNEGEQDWEITIPVNATGLDRTNTITYTAYYPDGTQAWQETTVIVQEGSSSFLLTESGGYILTEGLDKIKI